MKKFYYFLLLSVISCSSSNLMQEPISPTTKAVITLECVDENDHAIICEQDSDCCTNFYCGIDPEKNHRVKYCLFSGDQK